MTIDAIFHDASSGMTVISLITFLAILVWTFLLKRERDFDTQATLPFADDDADRAAEAAFLKAAEERRHG